MDHDRNVRAIAARLVAEYGPAALEFATDQARRRLAAGDYLSLLTWAKVSVAVAVMLDGRDRLRQPRREQRRFGDVAAAVLHGLRDADN